MGRGCVAAFSSQSAHEPATTFVGWGAHEPATTFVGWGAHEPETTFVGWGAHEPEIRMSPRALAPQHHSANVSPVCVCEQQSPRGLFEHAAKQTAHARCAKHLVQRRVSASRRSRGGWSPRERHGAALDARLRANAPRASAARKRSAGPVVDSAQMDGFGTMIASSAAGAGCQRAVSTRGRDQELC
jgi:hypothetical protein